MPQRTTVPPEARARILTWYAAHGRDLAFRRTPDPYAVLVSEAMAQRTQAARAAEHWERFMARFPTVAHLAAASPADVLREWRGLGYNRRALALWRAAKAIVAEHDGRVPDSVEGLQALPGVGPYTARAVAAIAFGRELGAVDVNVRRVLGRMLAADAGGISPSEMQAVADRTVPQGRAADWTHAVMDIGATLCRPREPRCADCPARPWCRYATAGSNNKVGKVSKRANRPSPPFATTNRWLRGRILDRLRAVSDDHWVEIEVPIGTHDAARVHAAVESMAAEGLIEIHPRGPNAGATADIAVRARLATA